MASFTKGGAAKIPFGKNVYLRSTKSLQFESYTFAANSLASQTIDGVAGEKILQPGTVLAKITSGPDSGKVGPFQAAGTADVWTITPGGTWSGGTFTLTVNGQTTAPIVYNAAIGVIQTAVQALSGVGAGNLIVGGGPQFTTATTYTAAGNLQGSVTISINVSLVTGSTPTGTPVHTTTGIAGSLDGRSSTANIVGVNDTFLPWQLMERDVEVAALYAGTVIQGWCFEYNAAGLPIAVQNSTATAMFAQKGLDVLFK